MPAVARCGTDNITTGHPCTASALIQGANQSSVYIEGSKAAIQGDAILVHTILIGDNCVNHASVINAGSSKVFIGGTPIARTGDSADLGAISSGSGKVSAGG